MFRYRAPKSEDLSKLLEPTRNLIDEIEKKHVGKTVLVDLEGNKTLITLEGVDLGETNPFNERVNRNHSVGFIGNLIEPDRNHPYTHQYLAKRITGLARLELLGTHKISFNWDEEFSMYLPSSQDHTDLYIKTATIYGDQRIEDRTKDMKIINDEEEIRNALKEITRASYFNRNIEPLLEGRPTGLALPTTQGKKGMMNYLFAKKFGNRDKRKPVFREFDRLVGQKWLKNAAEGLNEGDFLYVGGPSEVYLLTCSKEEYGIDDLFFQGTYTTSRKPMFWFSNNFMGNDTQQTLEWLKKEKREIDIPASGGLPFVFTAMGRRQDVKNQIFTGEPEVITSDLQEALEHFRTTSFFEFEDVVTEYHRRRHDTCGFKSQNGIFY